MGVDLFALLKPWLHMLDPETAHRLTIWALKAELGPVEHLPDLPMLRTRVWHLDFPNPLGMAAGFDKHGEVMRATLDLGFGFTEIGSITPQPQPGNPRPRVFRIKEAEAVINRYGFNSEGAGPAVDRMTAFRQEASGIVGVNLGKNKQTVHAEGDYVALMQKFYPLADYLVVNISSPNTEGLRDLQQRKFLDALLETLTREKKKLDSPTSRKPLLIKISPDENEQTKRDIAELVLWHEVDGMIVSNTTLTRPAHLPDRVVGESGGLSGAPLFLQSTAVLSDIYALTNGRVPIIGVGGVFSAAQAFEKIRAGAALVQLYTALIYHGPAKVVQIIIGLAQLLRQHGFDHLEQAIGSAHGQIQRPAYGWGMFAEGAVPDVPPASQEAL